MRGGHLHGGGLLLRTIQYNSEIAFFFSSSPCYSAPVDGSSQTTVANILNVSAHSLAYDWEHGHFFLTETGRFQIELFTVNGDGQGSLLPQSISSSRELNSPKELAFDLEKL